MKPATTSKRHFEETRVLAITSQESRIRHVKVRDLIDIFNPGDLLVVNRSATLPSSFHGVHELTKTPVEVRLASFRGSHQGDLSSWQAIAFGPGDWRTPTENREKPKDFKVGDRIFIGKELAIRIEAVHETFNRLVQIKFISSDLISSLYKFGKPIQYSYMSQPLEVWDQQTLFAGPALSVEPPSAAFALTWDLFFKLRERGLEVASLLHGAGISSTGSEDLDRYLPLEEWFEVPGETVEAIAQTKHRKGKVIALGTTVARALESAVNSIGELESKSGYTNLKIGPNSILKVVDGLISGLHEKGTSHLELSRAFCNREIIEQAYHQAQFLPYRNHEYGDLSYLSCY